MLKKKYNYILLGMCVFFMLGLAGCHKKEAKKDAGLEIIPVRAMEIRLKELDKALEYVGNIKAQDEVLVYPKITGKVIEKLKEDGSPVNKGDAIIYVDRDEVGLKFEKAPVESPLSGIIGRVYVDIGSNVLSQNPVALVVNMDKVKINLDIPEVYLPKINLLQEAEITVDAYPQEKFSGKVTKVSPVVNLENRAAPVEITIDNTGHRLKSGMFAKVSLVIERRPNVAVILKEAIIGKGENTYVYTVENNKAATRKISLGIHDGPLYEVTQGLKEGEMVVVMGQQRLYNDAPVAVEIANGDGGINTK